jgi:hypothetical protein
VGFPDHKPGGDHEGLKGKDSAASFQVPRPRRAALVLYYSARSENGSRI